MNGKANVNKTVEQLQANCDYIGTYKKLIGGGVCMQVKGTAGNWETFKCEMERVEGHHVPVRVKGSWDQVNP